MTIVRWFAGGWASRIYLALVAVAMASAVWELLAWVERRAYVEGTFPVFATAPALFLTAPTSLLLEWWLLPAVWDGLWRFTGPVLVGALVNIAALKGARALVRRRRLSAGPPAAAGTEPRGPHGRR
jgi:hypothetical protein